MRKFDANVLIKDSSRPGAAARGDAGEIGRLFSAIYKKYHAPFGRRVAGAILTERGAHILRAVRGMETNATIGALARRMQLTPSTVSLLASRLERQGSCAVAHSAAEPLVVAARRLSAFERRSLLGGLRKLDVAVGASTMRQPAK